MNKEFEIPKNEVNIVDAEIKDAESILSLIKAAPDALIEPSLDEIQKWIEAGQSIVAKTNEGKIIGHQGMASWEISNVDNPIIELRSAFVDPGYRGMGINTKMKQTMITKSWIKYPDSVIIGFTEAASKSRGILENLGFEEVPLDSVIEELFSICPVTCLKKTGVDCGCKIYIKFPPFFYSNR